MTTSRRPAGLHWRSLHEARKHYRKSVDIVLYRQSTYDSQAGGVGTLAYRVALEGIVVFDREDGETAE